MLKFRESDWFDNEREATAFGIQCQEKKGESWKHLAIDGKPAVYETSAERDKVMSNIPKGCTGDIGNCQNNEGYGCCNLILSDRHNNQS